jgi:hypothetical protein
MKTLFKILTLIYGDGKAKKEKTRIPIWWDYETWR